ncbi:hypothetical protein CPC735_039650 [Coccidioides posadasii C735 delta SOWgp]|uniref:Mucin n=4 Tax=Coccidioides posadasii TaxID=199306 RepID=E9CU74_COCPS|nr:hypothetical protein CPC735_039650 [Coccidioides posadasii C735 delta SOWgp]EER28701.1 hypothetical protein CPC735_039650 [Coccidioides posadasii C735 delta SOWgp]EFW22263.1 conserved hypothetical protein [Coccidioides posadasii str. Silveira]KMM64193.1 hypothetical protein CPAG_00545 [Coccidioides posadasii RMSCC 3488]|eukprot:XP_003070846.1 hypothetical protein CPC735_039650 [Coccidioides posadasii C735 delta SOWgp]
MGRRNVIILEQRPEDLDALPPALRRKLFSNLERFRLEQMRLAQTHPGNNSRSHAAHPRLQNGHSADPIPRTRTPKINAPCAARANGTKRRLRSKKYARRPILTKGRILFPQILKKPETLQTAYLAAQADSQWFRSLPPKVQQQHFSIEERACFGSWRSSLILDAADQALYKLGCQARVSSESILSSVPSVTTSSSATYTSSAHHPDSAVDMDDSMYDSFRWLDEDEDLDLRLDYHSHIAPSTPMQPHGGRKPSFKRTCSFSSSQKCRSPVSGMLPKPSQSHNVPPFSPPVIPPKKHHRPLSRSEPPPRHVSQTSVTSIDHPAQYYQDPEARLKLRVYLASPQKFDEAIEFGFPSLELKEGFNSRLSIDREWALCDDRRTFFDNDSKSFLGETLNETNNASLNDQDHNSPPNTSSIASTIVNASHESRSSKQSTRPRLVSITHNNAQNMIGNREMTLKMTLTRADLRTTDPSTMTSPSASENDDPLRLADLPAPDEQLHIWDTPPEDKGVMRKLLRKLRKRR